MSLSLHVVSRCGYPLPRSMYVIKRAHHRSSGVSESKLTPLNLRWFRKNARNVHICARILACDKRSLWKSPHSWLNQVRNAMKHIRLKLEIIEIYRNGIWICQESTFAAPISWSSNRLAAFTASTSAKSLVSLPQMRLVGRHVGDNWQLIPISCLSYIYLTELI